MENTIKDTIKNSVEVIKERLFSPMYFYFILAWLITNWKFVYTMLCTSEETIWKEKRILKIDFLQKMYSLEDWNILWSLAKLFFIPAISAVVIVWVLSSFAEKFYEKHEEHKLNKIYIKRELEYRHEVRIYKIQRAIRNAESDKNDIKYADNRDFNNHYDELNGGTVKIGGYDFLPSEVLYKNDYDAYKDALTEYENDRHGDEINVNDLPF